MARMKYEIPNVDDKPIWDIWLSFYRLPTVTAALESGILEALADAPSTPGQVGQKCGIDRKRAEIMLQMLAAMDLLEREDDRYKLAAVARLYLLPDSPYYWGGLLEVVCESNQQHMELMERLCGKKVLPAMAGDEEEKPVEAWESGQVDMEMARRIAGFMHSHSVPAAAGMANSGLLEGVRRLLDVGGGSGCFSIALAQHYPDMHCTVMELPSMCEVVGEYIAAGKVDARVDAVSVDMFREDWPEGYDAHLFSNVFHDWDMETNAQLAANAYKALSPGGQIILHEMLLNDSGVGPVTANAFSVLMLSRTKGFQFRFDELRELLEAAGFSDIEVQESYGYYSIVRGYKK
jgi:acetylserotonin N-methyltransferase